MERKRVAVWDNLKFALILLVVIGHFGGYIKQSHMYSFLFTFIYSFHMSLFIFLSGLFWRKKTAFVNGLYYLILFYVLKIGIFLTQYSINGKARIRWFYEDGIPWFCFVLFAFSLLTLLLDKLKIEQKFVFPLSVILSILIGYARFDINVLVIGRTLFYYPFYLLGVMFPQEKIIAWTNRKGIRIAGVIILIAWALICYFDNGYLSFLNGMFSGKNPYGDNIRQYGYLIRLIVYVINVILGISWISVTPRKELPRITSWGGKTIQVYMWHRILLYALAGVGVVDWIISLSALGKILWFLAAVVSTILLSLPPFSFPSKQIKYLLDRCVALLRRAFGKS